MPIQPEILLILEAESLVNPIWVGKEDEQWGLPTQVGSTFLRVLHYIL